MLLQCINLKCWRKSKILTKWYASVLDTYVAIHWIHFVCWYIIKTYTQRQVFLIVNLHILGQGHVVSVVKFYKFIKSTQAQWILCPDLWSIGESLKVTQYAGPKVVSEPKLKKHFIMKLCWYIDQVTPTNWLISVIPSPKNYFFFFQVRE
jgi:hypothetical protein